MSWQTIRKGGVIYQKNRLSQLREEDGIPAAGIPTVKEFFERFTKAFIQVCAKYHSVTGTIPIEGERQTQSAVLPAMYEVADAVFVELPIPKRRKGYKKKTGVGRIDYWVYLKECIYSAGTGMKGVSVHKESRAGNSS
jgi:hypothetical protein